MAGKLVCPLCGVYTSLSPLPLKGMGMLLENYGSSNVHYRGVALKAMTDESYMSVPVGDTPMPF